MGIRSNVSCFSHFSMKFLEANSIAQDEERGVSSRSKLFAYVPYIGCHAYMG